MKRSSWFFFSNRRLTAPAAAGAGSRKGSTIVVVIALLLALTFLGIVGYTIGTQESSNAEYFSDGAKKVNFGVSRDVLFDWGLRQIILGTRLNERQSALHGGHMSLMATMLGDDLAPFNGQGINFHMKNGQGTNTPAGEIFVDQNYNGANDDNIDLDGDPMTNEAYLLMELNRAPFANGFGVALDQSLFPGPDVGYSYWDNNSPFLAFINNNMSPRSGSYPVDNNGASRTVVLPSYHRPQYLRSMAGVTPDQWYSSPLTQARVLRPHVEHRAVASNGQVTGVRRFISTRYPDTRPVGALERLDPFPFNTNVGAQMNDDNNPANDGVWDGVWAGGLANSENVSYDADPDNDGLNEAIWMDLGYPMQIRENPDGTVTKFVPMFGITLYDGDALFNLNAHGNIAAREDIDTMQFGPLGTSPVIGPTGMEFLSQSNEGLGVSEINPEWGLTASAGDTSPHSSFFGRAPASSVELANIEWFWLMSGRAEYDSGGGVNSLYPGRYGELDDLGNAVSSLNIYSFPMPGRRFGAAPSAFSLTNYNHLSTDDNLSANEGGSFSDQANLAGTGILVQNTVFPEQIQFPGWEHPLDLSGKGSKTTSLTQRRFFQDTANNSKYKWPAYDEYDTSPTLGLRDNDYYTTYYQNNLMQNWNRHYNVDEPEETILEPSLVRSDVDEIFGAGENAALHIAQPDQDALGLSGRVRRLAPINFDDTADIIATETRRRSYTSTSWDFKTYARAVYGNSTAANRFRNWEASTTFPPSFGGPNPFRGELQELLQLNNGSRQLSVTSLQRKLSINHVLDRDPNTGKLRFRPLTPHPVDDPNNTNDDYLRLGKSSVSDRFQALAVAARPDSPEDLKVAPYIQTDMTSGNTYVDPEAQEWLARRDRQKLCRDLYVLLYTLGGGDDNVNYTNNAPYNVDNERDPAGNTELIDANGHNALDEPRMMAQFVVNLVDQMDSDDVMTVFEYDQNLGNGWNLDDDPFDSSDTPMAPNQAERQVVVGVEKQALCLSEAQVILAKIVRDSSQQAKNHHATEYDDEKQNRDWTFVELENVTPKAVRRFGDGNWQIVIEENDPSTANPGFRVRKRWLTLLGNWTISPNSDPRFVIGTTGDEDNRGANNGSQLAPPEPLVPSHFRVDPDHNPTMAMGGPTHRDPFGMGGFQTNDYKISPRGNLDLDLVLNPSLYSVFPKQNNPASPTSNAEGDLPRATGDGIDFFGHTGDDYDPPSDAMNDPLKTLNQSDFNGTPIRITLRRRINSLRSGPTDASTPNEAVDNPWVEVDSMTVNVDLFALDDGDDFDEIRNKLAALRSSERREPLDANSKNNYNGTPADHKFNSLGLQNENSQALTVFSHYQQHFNRPFASPAELLSVPLYSPFDILPRILPNENTNAAINQHSDYKIAAHKFLNPNFPNSVDPDDERDNRWYRLFEFIEVPDRTHRHPSVVGQDLLATSPFILDIGRTGNLGTFYRKPGHVQLNTLRHPEVLGGILDDPQAVRLSTSGTNYLVDQGGDAPNRDWWKKFIQSRDGRDPVTSGFLPGLPYGGTHQTSNERYGSKPFRDFSFSAQGTGSIEDTLLRKLPHNTALGETPFDRLLFEIGTENQRDNGSVEHSLRHRMLAKMLNNTTNRSNVFLIFIQVDFFEAAEVTTNVSGNQVNVVRVGSKLADSPAYRGFFVVDRSKIYEVLGQLNRERQQENPPRIFNTNTEFLPQTFVDPVDSAAGNKFNFSFNQNFDYHRLILHRQTIN